MKMSFLYSLTGGISLDTNTSMLFSSPHLLGVKMYSFGLDWQARKCVGVSFYTKHLVFLARIQKKLCRRVYIFTQS